MTLAPRSRIASLASLASVFGAALAFALGCGGSVYSFGSVPDDGGAPDAHGRSGFSPPSDGSDSGNVDVPVCGATGCDAGTANLSGGGNLGGGHSGGTDAGDGCAIASIGCPSDTTGYQCGITGGPPVDPPNLSCTSSGANGRYCCFPWPTSNGACVPFPSFPCDGNSYAYQCHPGTAPHDVDPKLSCGQNFVDSNGSNNFCCTYS